jgi:hypothetical protein
MNTFATFAIQGLKKWYLLVCAAIIVWAVVTRVESREMPEIAPQPVETLPTPNAWDTFKTADAAILDRFAVGNATNSVPTYAPPPGDNPASPDSMWHKFTHADMDHLVSENAQALSLIHTGLTQKYMTPPNPDNESGENEIESAYVIIQFDNVANLLKLKAKDDSVHGQWGAAMNACLDMLQIGSDIPHGSAMAGLYCGIGFQNRALNQIISLKISDHLTPDQSAAAALRIAEIERNQVPLDESAAMQERVTLKQAYHLLQNENWRQIVLKYRYGNSPGFNAIGDPIIFALYTRSPRQEYDLAKQFMDAEVAQSKLPWPERGNGPSFPDVFCEAILPGLQDFHLPGQFNRTYCRFLEVQLALKAYQERHGAFPTQLIDLDPSYLPSIPLDPFSDKQPLKYKASGRVYILYSIGPDDVDDGGKPIVNIGDFAPTSRQAHDPERNVNALGDIVAGVNISVND